MVDINDVRSLEQHQRDTDVTVAMYDWAISNKIPNVRAKTLRGLYARYKDHPNTSMVRKMCRSHTGLSDPERAAHEIVIEQYPHWDYEVKTDSGYVDFIDPAAEYIIEVKDARSWKQCGDLLFYERYFPDYKPVALLFGDVNNTKLMTKVWEDFQYAGITLAVLERGVVRFITEFHTT